MSGAPGAPEDVAKGNFHDAVIKVFIEMFNKDPGVARELYAQSQLDQRPFSSRGTIMQGRLLQLRGFDRGDYDTPGAKKLFMQSRMSKKDLGKFNTAAEELSEDSPLVKGLPKDPTARRAVLMAGRDMAVRSKDVATYWLGTTSMNSGEYKVASDFFKLIVADEDSRWQQSANYNLGRAYEKLGEKNEDPDLIAKAISCYEGDRESPQLSGNLLRAKLLSEGN